jgi:2-amino-4-hydroxy-6-hydroxymethyldihydropteridine diphosphokinase
MRSAFHTKTSFSSVAIALGSNIGNRRYWLARAVVELGSVMTLVRLSAIYETEPVDAPPGSAMFLNQVVVGFSSLSPERLHSATAAIETKLGRRRGPRNAPRNIDIDLILVSAIVRRSTDLTLPHPRYQGRDFVLEPLRALQLSWRDPLTGAALG